MDVHHSFRFTQESADSLREIAERVAVFREDNKLAAVPMSIEHFRVVLQEARQFIPFLIRVRLANFRGQRFKAAERISISV